MKTKVGIKITFTTADFQAFIDYLKENEEIYKSVTEISKTGNDNPFIKYNREMLSLDKITEILVDEIPKEKKLCEGCDKSKCKVNYRFTSADALYIVCLNNEIKLYFIEFKNIDTTKVEQLLDTDIEKSLSTLFEFLCKIRDDSTVRNKVGDSFDTDIDEVSVINSIKYLKKARKKARNSYQLRLNLKPMESLYSDLPWIYQLYCKDKGITLNIDSFKSYLLNCKKEYVIIDEVDHYNRSHKPHTQRISNRSCQKMYSKRLMPHPFDKVIVRTKSEFRGFFDQITDSVTKVLS